jgi:hypothetical protein
MKILKRLYNIWNLGGIELFPNGHYQTLNPITGEPIIPIPEKPKPQMAKIIKRKLMSVDEEVEDILKE